MIEGGMKLLPAMYLFVVNFYSPRKLVLFEI